VEESIYIYIYLLTSINTGLINEVIRRLTYLPD